MTLREEVAMALDKAIGSEGEVYWALERGTEIPVLALDRIADAAIALVLERAAQVAEGYSRTMRSPVHTDTGKMIAGSIRNLAKEQQP